MIPIYADDIKNSTVAKTRGTVFRCIGGRAWRPVTDPTTTWEDWYEAGRAERYSYVFASPRRVLGQLAAQLV